MAAKGTQFLWQWDSGTFPTTSDVLLGESVNMTSHDDWLALTQEETLEPELPICDPHHHLWEFYTSRVVDRYLLDDIRADLESSHNVTSTVFIECSAMYKTDGAQGMWVIGETEFVNGIAAMSASGLYGTARIAAGIIGSANLSYGDAIAPVLEAHISAGGGRFRGIRDRGAWDVSNSIQRGNSKTPQHLFLDETFRQGFAQLAKHELIFGCCQLNEGRSQLNV